MLRSGWMLRLEPIAIFGSLRTAVLLSAMCILGTPQLGCGTSSDGSPSNTTPEASPGPQDGAAGGDSSSDSTTPDGGDETGDATGECLPKTCAQLDASCGEVSDGCGGTLDCGACLAPDTCGGAGVENQCGCTAKSCAQVNASCGDVDTGCGTVNCGDCIPPDTCGGGGVDNQCGCACSLAHASASCLSGNCAIAACNPGWANCDALDANGCETDVANGLDDCGACGSTCELANAQSFACAQGACVVVQCKPGFLDCDGEASNGCEVNGAADPTNCASCGHACPAVGGTPVCVLGVCGVSGCSAGLGDCDTTAAGCETNLNTSLSHCGFCNNPCSLSHASSVCQAGECEIDACDKYYGDCDASPGNGCETNTAASVDNCGGCGSVCAPRPNSARACVASQCTFACLSSFTDCDGAAPNGCEIDVATSPDNCGACFSPCSGNNVLTRTCQAGTCTSTCAAPYDDCNHDRRVDGCETNTASTVDHCGGCGRVCSSNHVMLRKCIGSQCSGTCEPGWSDCNGDLVSDGCETNTGSSADNCGACGRVCSGNHIATRTCAAGVCNGNCSPGYGDCNQNKQTDGCEVNLLTSKTNCGTCGHGCGDCGACSNGSCVGVPCE